jgi:hypothetical protein
MESSNGVRFDQYANRPKFDRSFSLSSSMYEQDETMVPDDDIGVTPRLRREDLVSIPMLGDGNCLFHSLASSLSSPDR